MLGVTGCMWQVLGVWLKRVENAPFNPHHFSQGQLLLARNESLLA